MHKEILSSSQIDLLSLISSFSKDFGLVGGTAIALHIGHRRSIDFDLFTLEPIKNNLKLREKILKFYPIDTVFINNKDEFTILVNGVKITFLHYPFPIKFTEKLENFIKIPNLLTLSAMKAYVLGRRAKWKDYVDLYFIIKDYHGINDVIKKAKQIFVNEFNEKIFRSQLAYFKDINCDEKIDYWKGFKIKDEIIKRELKKFSVSL